MQETLEKCRLDKWLWAARFYKTRSLATTAIDSGKVHVDNERVKPAKEVRIGQVIRIRRPSTTPEIEITVLALSNQRRGAPEAALLYAETEASQHKRAEESLTRVHEHGLRLRGSGRPTKRQRRDIDRYSG